MKKNSILAIMLVVAMSSCSQNDIYTDGSTPSVDGLVALDVATGTSRGTDVTTDVLEKSLTGVKLHIKDAANVNDAYDFNLSSEGWGQTSSTLKWEDIEFPAHFYSMHDGESKTLSLDDESASHNYTVSGSSSTHKDLVYSANKLNTMPTGGVVTLFHKHALSKIHLYAATGGNNVYIASVNIVSVDGEGNVSIAPVSATDVSTATGVTWTNGESNEASYEYYYIGTKDVVSDPDPDTGLTTVTEAKPVGLTSSALGSVIINSDEDAPLMIIPQTTTAAKATQIAKPGIEVDDTYIQVIYYMTDSDDQKVVGYSSVAARPDSSKYIEADQDKVLYVMGAFPLCYTFDENKEYDITLGLGKSGSTGGILIADYYVDRDGNEVELTLKDTETTTTPEIPEIDEGDDILPGATDLISIDVEVLDWEDGTDTEIK